MQQLKFRNFFLVPLMVYLLSCEGEEGPIGPTGLNSLGNITNEPPGNNCEYGGIKVEVGIDENSNGTLENEEIISASYVCNAADGNSSLSSLTTEPSGMNCVNGGIKIDSGVDTNANGILDDTEIATTAYICNGIDGNDSLIKITNEAAGENCENGGLKIDSGLDNNRNGTLDDSEITASTYVCNGVDGINSLNRISNEGAGDNCENGGVVIDSGVDQNGNGMLDEDEIQMTKFICNGIDGVIDEQIRFVIYSIQGGASGNSSTSGVLYGDLVDFDIGNYPEVDSAVFVTNIYISDRNIDNNAIAELYNSTDGLVVSNSTVMTNSLEAVTLFSGDIFNSLPSGKVTLNIRLRNETSGTAFIEGNSYLLLYRQN